MTQVSDNGTTELDMANQRIAELEAWDHYNMGMAEQYIAENNRLRAIGDRLKKAWIEANKYMPVQDGSSADINARDVLERFRGVARAAKEMGDEPAVSEMRRP